MTSPLDTPAPDAARSGTRPQPDARVLAQVTDACALLVAGELAGFARLADDAAHAPDLRSRIVLSRMAAANLTPLERVEEYVLGLGVDPEVLDDGIWHFREVLGGLDDRTVPRDWWERLIRTYIGYGLVADLEKVVVDSLSGRAQEIGRASLVDSGVSQFVVDTLTPLLQVDPQLGARLALWGRRVVGESLGVATRMLQGRPALAELVGIVPGSPQAPEQLAAVMSRLTSAHARRMNRLDLTA